MTHAARFSISVVVLVTGAAVAEDKPDEETRLKVAALVRQLKSAGGQEKIKCLNDLARVGVAGRPAAKMVADACFDSSDRIKLAAYEALEKIWPELYQAAILLLRDNENNFSKSEKRQKACETIMEMGEGAEAGIPFLVAHLRLHLEDDDFFGVNSALSANIKALIKLDPLNPTFHKLLQAGAGPVNKRSRNRALAIEGLGDLGEQQPKLRRTFIPIMKQALQTAGRDYDALRAAAVEALGKFGKDARTELTLLKKLKLDTAEVVRKAATVAVEKIEADK